MDIASEKVGKLTLLDGALIGGSKILSEELSIMAGLGNGTLKSGLIKCGVAVGGSFFTGNNKNFQIPLTGVLIDGMEDLALGVRRMIFGGKDKKNGNSSQSIGGNQLILN
ncbi:MAG: hypothetical protein ACOC1P_00595 [Minisyncoccales bacterium]